ncbi:hypothetical protein Nepgr_030493 [Nepenthes gracilis]|uniref:Uncharacterized protein n=1 Tax=Nepenthes gracilis TaxID=150966 RepID=A0AAD3Y5T2_NEPGR|nr:hypothetical protein Nepgr_030493 [Nepenthes gracilis]
MVDISKLSQLTSFDLSGNSLEGKVPSWLFSLPSLKGLSLDFNQFSGQLTISEDVTRASPLTNLSSLMSLSLSHCKFSGPLPVWILNVTQEIDLSDNQFTGKLSSMVDISKLSQLTSFDLSGNSLEGKVPSWLFSLPSLKVLSLGFNQFSGQLTISEDVARASPLMNLSSLMSLSLLRCKFSEPLPVWIWNITHEIDLSFNLFTGKLPSMVDISKLSQLTSFDLSENSLEGKVPSWLFSLPSLKVLSLDFNQFSGQLTISEDVARASPLTNLSSLMSLSLLHCKFSGPLPVWILNITQEIDLSYNQFTGKLPSMVDISKLSQLTRLYLSGNSLEGKVPS